jgi:hypothetical protein
MVLIGIVFIVFAAAVGVAHYGLHVPVHDRSANGPASDGTIGVLLAALAGMGVLLTLLGRAILRAAARHDPTGSRAGTGR